jgi:protein TonB
MNWQDDEFESYLRQFELRRPKALPAPRRTVVMLAAAAALAAVIIVPMSSWPWGDAAVTPRDSEPGEPGQAAAPIASAPAGANPSDAIAGVNRPEAGRANELGTGVSKRPDGFSSGRPAASARGGAVVMEGADEKRVRVGGPIRPPRRIYNVDPDYPEEAQSARVQGMVILDIVIGVDGRVVQTQVIQSIPELDQAAIDAVRQWRYEPTLLNGEPVEVAMHVTVNFTLR